MSSLDSTVLTATTDAVVSTVLTEQRPVRHSRRSFSRTALLAVAGLSSAVMLSGCGFHLRGSNGEANLPFRTIFIAVGDTSPLGVELKRNIRATANTSIVTDPKLADARLEVLSEVRDREIQSLNSQGRIREYTLFYRLTFRA